MKSTTPFPPPRSLECKAERRTNLTATPPYSQSRKYGEHLYLKGNIYYFRYTLSVSHQTGTQRKELRISLGTGLKRDAKRYATRLHSALLEILHGSQHVDYNEIRMRMNGLLRALLDQDDMNLSPREGLQFSNLNIDLSPAGLRQCLSNIIHMQMNNIDSVSQAGRQCIPHLLEINAFDSDEITPDNILFITKEYLKIQATYQDIVAKRCQGDYLAEQAVFSAPYTPFPRNSVQQQEPLHTPQPPLAPHSIQLSQLIERYINTKLSDGAWGESSLPDHRQRLSAFVEIIGDKPIRDITREDMRAFRDTLRKLPPNRNKSKTYRGKSIPQLLKMKHAKVLSIKTVNITVEAVASLFEWCTREGVLSTNPAKGLQLKDKRQEIELRDAFTEDDLQKIFSAPQYQKNTFKHPSHFWMPLIGLFTGMRREEIAQLHVTDLYHDENSGLWLFDINDTPSRSQADQKRLKNKNARRIVPVHETLIQIGLLHYQQRIKDSGSVRLFPELKKTKGSQRFGHQPGKVFSELIKQQGIVGKKTFHSLRHTFSDFFKQRLLHNDIFRQVYGHEIPELAGKQYGSKFPPELCYNEVISKLIFEIDFNTLLNIQK